MSFVFSALSNLVSDEDSIVRKSLPIFVLIAYSFGGAGIYYAIELNGSCTAVDYWVSLWFVNTVITTIGYGNVVPCSDGGKIFTIFYAFVGVPLTLVAFNNVGIIMIKPLAYLYAKCSDNNNNKVNVSGKENKQKKFPLSLGLLLTFIWIFGSGGYFYALSQLSNTRWYPYSNWTYAESLYFMFISITTIGFGDFFPTNYQFTALHFVFIIVGLSLFSLCINLVQEKIVDFVDTAKERIFQLYAESLTKGGGIDDVSIKSQIAKIKGGRLMYQLMGKGVKNELQTKLDDLAGRRCKLTQTEWPTEEIAVQVNGGSREQKTVICQTQKSFSPYQKW